MKLNFTLVFKIQFFLLCFWTSQSLAENIIQPKIYTANNEAYSLLVSPMSSDGLKGAEYSLMKNGELVWSKTLSSSAVAANVASTGESVICSYSKGIEPRYDLTETDYGYMQISLFDHNGQLRWSQSIKRQMGMGMHSPPSPYCEQVLVQEHSQQAFFWYHQNQQTQLQVIDIKTGMPVVGIKIATDHAIDLTSVDDIKFYSIDDSELLLASVTGYVYEDNEDGTGYDGYQSDVLYYLFDTQGEVIWHKPLMGSIDLRKTTKQEQLQQAYSKRKNYLKQHDLIQFIRSEKQFGITDYNKQQLHWYQLAVNEKVTPLRTETLVADATPFEAEVENQTSPPLLHSIDLTAFVGHEQQESKCSQKYEVIDLLSDGSLILYEESSRRITQFSDLQQSPKFFTVAKDLYKDEYISQQQMFVDSKDQISINLGDSSYAKYNADGNLLGVSTISPQSINPSCGVSIYCNLDVVAQKATSNLWIENDQLGVMLVEPIATGFKQHAVTLKDSSGQWFEYNYEIQNDERGRLLMLGRVAGAINHIYVLDIDAKPMVTLDIGHGYTASATLTADYIFISEAENEQIAVINFSGEVIRRFKTSNNQPPYLLKASQNKLYAVTLDAVLIYDMTGIINSNIPRS